MGEMADFFESEDERKAALEGVVLGDCPFCGEAQASVVDSQHEESEVWGCFVRCGHCNARGNTVWETERDPVREAAGQWNQISRLVGEVR